MSDVYIVVGTGYEGVDYFAWGGTDRDEAIAALEAERARVLVARAIREKHRVSHRDPGGSAESHMAWIIAAQDEIEATLGGRYSYPLDNPSCFCLYVGGPDGFTAL